MIKDNKLANADIVVDLDTSKIDFIKPQIKKIISLNVGEKEFCKNILTVIYFFILFNKFFIKINTNKKINNSGDSFVWEGNDDWIRFF